MTNFSRPFPPPPSPSAPSPLLPPLPLVGECAASAAEACHAWFVKETDYTYTYECNSTDASCTPSSNAKDICSDGGFGAHAIIRTSPVEEAEFACAYGTQCWYNADGEIESPCATAQRPRDAVVDINCADDASLLPEGSCRDSCWVDTDGTVHMEEERFTTSSATPDKQCHDGGVRAISNKCPYGTQSTRCGPARPVVYAGFKKMHKVVGFRASLPLTTRRRRRCRHRRSRTPSSFPTSTARACTFRTRRRVRASAPPLRRRRRSNCPRRRRRSATTAARAAARRRPATPTRLETGGRISSCARERRRRLDGGPAAAPGAHAAGRDASPHTWVEATRRRPTVGPTGGT